MVKSGGAGQGLTSGHRREEKTVFASVHPIMLEDAWRCSRKIKTGSSCCVNFTQFENCPPQKKANYLLSF